MDNGPVGIKDLVDCHTGEYANVLPQLSEGWECNGQHVDKKWFGSIKCQEMYMSSDIIEKNSNRNQNNVKITEINITNQANLRDLIAVTGLLIILKLDSNHWFFSPCDLRIWWTTSTKNGTPLLHYIKLCALFQSHGSIQTGATVRKRSTRVEIGDFCCPV